VVNSVAVLVCPTTLIAAALTSVALAVNVAPTVNNAELTLVLTLANPVIVVLPVMPNVVELATVIILRPPAAPDQGTIAKLALPIPELPTATIVVSPAVVRELYAPAPALGSTPNEYDPFNIFKTWTVFAAAVVSVIVVTVELAINAVPTVNKAVLTLVLTLAKPVMVVLPAARRPVTFVDVLLMDNLEDKAVVFDTTNPNLEGTYPELATGALSTSASM